MCISESEFQNFSAFSFWESWKWFFPNAISPQWSNSTLKWGNGLLGSFEPCQNNKTKSFRFDGVMKVFLDSKSTSPSWTCAKTDSVGLELLHICDSWSWPLMGIFAHLYAKDPMSVNQKVVSPPVPHREQSSYPLNKSIKIVSNPLQNTL